MKVLQSLFARRPSSAPDPYQIGWVGQKEGNGCLIASVAMVMGVSYWTARALFPGFDPAEGAASSDGLRVLGEYGWAYASKYQHYSPEKRDRKRWPVDPFAPVHLCAVRSPAWHAVILTADGGILDPLRSPDAFPGLRLSHYPAVLEIHGLWKVR